MSNNQNPGKSSQSNSPQSQEQRKQYEELLQKLKNIELKTANKLKNQDLHKQRLQHIEKENPINKNAMTTTIDTTQQKQQEQKSLDNQQVEECIQFKLISETNQISIKESKSFVCGVQLQVKQPQSQESRVPMDLVCVIDDSGSMSGKKAQLVRKSLKYLLKIINENDRICLISFDSNEKILTPFLRNNEENKSLFKVAIKSIGGRASTNIEGGMEAGLWMIKNRKEKNPVTCLFLLSDGQDDQAGVDLRVQKLILEYGISDNFIVNTYGYGADHDSKQMRNIAETHKGSYYYIENVKKVSEWFVLSISGLLSAIGEDVRIRIKQKNSTQTNIKVSQVYGGDQLWIKQDYEKGNFEIYLPHLIIGDNKFFVFDCQFSQEYFKLSDQNRCLPIFEAEIEVRAVKQEYIIRKQDSLYIEFQESDNSEIQGNSKESYFEELMVTHSRALGGMKIKQANELNKKQEYSQAKFILEEYKQTMKRKNVQMSANKGIQHLEEDLDDAIQKSNPRMFRQASFEKMEVIHQQRRNSITHCEDWNDEQVNVMKKFKNKDICLSDDSCSRSGSGSDSSPRHNKKNFPKASMQSRHSGSQNSDSASDSESGSDDEAQIKQNPVQRQKSLVQRQQSPAKIKKRKLNNKQQRRSFGRFAEDD